MELFFEQIPHEYYSNSSRGVYLSAASISFSRSWVRRLLECGVYLSAAFIWDYTVFVNRAAFRVKMGKRSKVWDYFYDLGDGTARCKKCKTVVKCNQGSTSGLFMYLETKDKIFLREEGRCHSRLRDAIRVRPRRDVAQYPGSVPAEFQPTSSYGRGTRARGERRERWESM